MSWLEILLWVFFFGPMVIILGMLWWMMVIGIFDWIVIRMVRWWF